jgi:hypothetical protein
VFLTRLRPMSTVQRRSSSQSNESSAPETDSPPAVSADPPTPPEQAQTVPHPSSDPPQSPSVGELPIVASQAPPSTAQSLPPQPRRTQTATTIQTPQSHGLLHSFLRDIGYGRRGTLMRRHFTILACKIFLAIGQVRRQMTKIQCLDAHYSRRSPLSPR